MAEKAARLGMPAMGLTDHGNLGACVEFTKVMIKVGVRPLLGVEFYICRTDPDLDTAETRKLNGRPYQHLLVYARNQEGWSQLLRATSKSWSKSGFYYSPRLCLENFRDFAANGGLMAVSGHPGSTLADALFTDPRLAYRGRDRGAVRRHIHPDWQDRVIGLAEQHVSVFGPDRFWVEIQNLDPELFPAGAEVADAMRWLADRMKLPSLATCDAHYVSREDAFDQRTILCAKFRTTHDAVRQRIEQQEEIELSGFFNGNHFHIHSEEEMLRNHRHREVAATHGFAAMFEDVQILQQPRMPRFPCPGGMDERAYLRELCERGLRRRFPEVDISDGEYRGRLEMELGVIESAGLSPYFLIVQDLVQYGLDRGWLLGPGRGSAAGCLVSYLIGVTKIDPIPYSLMFERFYNAGRNKPGHVSLPDVDLDFPLVRADEVFRYAEKKYGKDKVGRIATFNSLQGRSALDEVLATSGVGFDERKEITKLIPDGARISEELEEMRQRGDEPSIVRYSLENLSDDLADYCRLEDDGTLSGQYADQFAQAMRLEGTKKNLSLHAAGVIISPVPLAEVCPLKYEASIDANVGAMDKDALEALGLLKLDLLRVAMLNKGEAVRSLALTGRIEEPTQA